MNRRKYIQRVILLGVALGLFLCHPLLAHFKPPAEPGAWPGLYLYLFGVWGVGIGLLWLMGRKA